MSLEASLPETVKDLLRSALNTEFASINGAGVPIDTPLHVFPNEDLSLFSVATGVAYPVKAERARRNPVVGLLIEGGGKDPVVSIGGIAAVRDSDVKANALRYLSEVGQYGASILHPWEVAQHAVWYWSRIVIEIAPKRVLWWPDRGAMNGPPQIWEAPATTVFPTSDPAPEGKGSASLKWDETPWREHVQPFLDRNARGHLSLFDPEGFPLPFAARTVVLNGDAFELDMPEGLPWKQGGPACLTFEGRATFVGEASGSGAATRFKVQRMLPVMPMVMDARQVMLPEGKEGLMERLKHELRRRGQAVPVLPPKMPEPTAGCLRRKARLEGRPVGPVAVD